MFRVVYVRAPRPDMQACLFSVMDHRSSCIAVITSALYATNPTPQCIPSPGCPGGLTPGFCIRHTFFLEWLHEAEAEAEGVPEQP